MYCSTCGKQLDSNANFCPGCGNRVSTSHGSSLNKAVSAFADRKSAPMFATIAISAIIILLTFGSMLKISGYSYSYNIAEASLHETIEVMSRLYQIFGEFSGIGTYSSGYTSDGALAVGLIIIGLAAMYIIPLMNAIYLWKVIKGDDPFKYYAARRASTVTIVLSILFIVAIYIFNRDSNIEYIGVSIEATSNAYIMIALAIVSKVILNKYLISANNFSCSYSSSASEREGNSIVDVSSFYAKRDQAEDAKKDGFL